MALVPEAGAGIPERRRPQFPSEPGHILIPGPYNIEGIGKGVVFFGTAYNIADTYTDVFGAVMTGDIEGVGAGFTDFHMVRERLFMDLTYQYLSKVAIQSYSVRGMDSSSDDYTLVEIDELEFAGGRVYLSFEERMFELYVQGYDGRFRLGALRDPDGEVIAEAGDSAESSFNLYGAGAVLDLTDDRGDPRRGVRFDTSLGWSPPKGNESVDYVVMDNNLTLYLPVGKRSTWAFNYFTSDAFVQSQGETDRAALEADLGFDCASIADPQEQAECVKRSNEYIDNLIAANRYGSAESLGGRGRLRSYPMDRFKGAHTAFFGTELRWNVTEESSPFDIGLMKDIRTGVQLAFFYEIGSVAESQGEVWDETRQSYGAGFRVVNASGLIYRLDYAAGDEGYAMTVIINYPWEAF
jgi:outer membrane protein assembly factor BamA